MYGCGRVPKTFYLQNQAGGPQEQLDKPWSRWQTVNRAELGEGEVIMEQVRTVNHPDV